MSYSIEDFQVLNSPEYLVITQHSRKRFAERGIQIEDVCNAISTGCIIEDYPEDYPAPSCLILGHSRKAVIHVCASIMDDAIHIITAYIPAPEKWENDWKTRKEETK